MASIAPRRKHSKARSRQRRAVTMRVPLPKTVECKNCGARVVMHRVCVTCGHYRGKAVFSPDN